VPGSAGPVRVRRARDHLVGLRVTACVARCLGIIVRRTWHRADILGQFLQVFGNSGGSRLLVAISFV